MKKIIALLMAAAMLLSLAACSESKPEPTEEPTTASTTAPPETTTEEPSTEPSTEPSAGTLGTTLRDAFLSEMETNPDATPIDIANALIANPAIEFAPIVEPMLPGYLPGFSADIDGFAEAAMFAPMIGSIAFVGYIFRLDESADVDAFIQTLTDNADPSWNICVTANETVIDAVGNTVFFVMTPGSAA